MFSRIFFLLAVLIFNLSFSQIKWMKWDEAMAAQKENPKKIFIEFYANYCKSCKEMDKTTFKNPQIYNYINENYYPVKFNVEKKKAISYKGHSFGFDKRMKMHAFPLYMSVNMTPCILFMDENTNPITILQGRLKAKELEPYLDFFATNKHLKIKTKQDWNNYLKKFNSRIK